MSAAHTIRPMLNVAFQGRKTGKMASNEGFVWEPSSSPHMVACRSLRLYVYVCYVCMFKCIRLTVCLLKVQKVDCAIWSVRACMYVSTHANHARLCRVQKVRRATVLWILP